MSIKAKFKNLFTVDDEYEYVDDDETYEDAEAFGQEQGNVVNLKTVKQPSSKVVLYEVQTYNEVQEIADQVINRRAVVINLQQLEQQEAKRIIDFLSGTVYAVDGNIQKLGAETFLCTPDNISVSGSMTDSLENNDDFSKGWS